MMNVEQELDDYEADLRGLAEVEVRKLQDQQEDGIHEKLRQRRKALEIVEQRMTEFREALTCDEDDIEVMMVEAEEGIRARVLAE